MWSHSHADRYLQTNVFKMLQEKDSAPQEVDTCGFIFKYRKDIYRN